MFNRRSVNDNINGNIGIITVEIADGSSSKLPVTNQTTPQSLIKIIGKKNGLETVQYFGLQAYRSFLITSANRNNSEVQISQPPSPLSAAPVGASFENEDRVFLVDDIPLVEQVMITGKTRLVLALKYCYSDPEKDLDGPKTEVLIYHEMAGRFKNCLDSIPRPALINMVSLVIHCRNLLKESGDSFVESVKLVLPKGSTFFLSDESFYDDVIASVKTVSAQSLERAAHDFLGLFSRHCSSCFNYYFEMIHPEFSLPLTVAVTPPGLSFKHEASEDQTLIPYRRMKNWSVGIVDGDSVVIKKTKGFPAQKQSLSRLKDSNSSLNLLGLSSERGEFLRNVLNASSSSLNGSVDKNQSFSSPSSTPILESFVKRANNIRRGTLGKKSGNVLSQKDKISRYIFSIELRDEYLKDIELVYLSLIPHDYHIIELIDFFNSRIAEDESGLKKSESSQSISSLAPVAVAKFDHESKNESNDLLFAAGDEVHILKKLDNDKYLGEKQGVQGIVDGENMSFIRKKDLLKSPSQAGFNTANGEILHIYLADDTKRTVMVNPSALGSGLRKQLIEKLELYEGEFFEIADVSGKKERWIHPDIPLRLQGITSSSKLVFKPRILFYDVSELSSPMGIYLYYLEVKKMALSGECAIAENEAIDLASLQLQATFGDCDPENQKGGFLSSPGALASYLPPPFSKMSMTKNESYWVKKIHAVYQQHRGLSKRDSEKAYIATCQRFPLFGYQIFYPVLPENLGIGLSRDGIAFFERETKIITEKHVVTDIMYGSKNSGFTSHIFYEENGVEKVMKIFTLDTLEIIENFWMLSVAETKLRQRRRCKFFREKLTSIGMPIDGGNIYETSAKYLRDPELFSLVLKNGTLFVSILEALKQPILSDSEKDVFTADPDLYYREVSEVKRIKNIRIFLNKAVKEFGVNTSPFEVEDIWPYNTNSFNRVTEFLFQFFSSSSVSEKVQRIAEIIKKKRRSKKGGNSDAQGSEMTEDDFLQKVFNELLATENAYVLDLQKIVDNYVSRLKPLVAEQRTEANDILALEMFGNIEEICEFHQVFSKAMADLGSDIEKVGDIGMLFSEKGDQFVPLYEKYCLNHTEPVEKLSIDVKLSPEAMNIIGFNGDPTNDQNARQNISAQIIKPVQRIMRYHLLLKELLKYTAKDSPPFTLVENGLNKMKEVASKINEIKRTKENAEIAKQLAVNIEGYEGPPIHALGPLLSHGKLGVMEKDAPGSRKSNFPGTKGIPMRAFLFEDILLLCAEYANKQKSGVSLVSFKVKYMLQNGQLEVKEISSDANFVEDSRFAWTIIRRDNQKSFILTSPGGEDKDRWLSIMKQCFEKAAGRPSLVQEYMDGLKLKFEDTNSQSNKRYAFGTIKRLGTRKKELDSIDTFSNDFQPSPRPLTTAPLNDNNRYIAEITTLNNQTESLLKQIQELQQTVRNMTEENGRLNDRIKQERQKSEYLERELAKTKQRPSHSPSQDFLRNRDTSVGVQQQRIQKSLSKPANMSSSISTEYFEKHRVGSAGGTRLKNELTSQMNELQNVLRSLSSSQERLSRSQSGGLHK